MPKTVARSTMEQLTRGLPYAPADTAADESASGNNTPIWTVPISEFQIVNATDAELTFIVSEAGASDGLTYSLGAGWGERFVGLDITQVAVTAGGTGKWYIRGYR